MTHLEAQGTNYATGVTPSNSPPADGETCGMWDLGVSACELPNDNAVGKSRERRTIKNSLLIPVNFHNACYITMTQIWGPYY